MDSIKEERVGRLKEGASRYWAGGEPRRIAESHVHVAPNPFKNNLAILRKRRRNAEVTGGGTQSEWGLAMGVYTLISDEPAGPPA